MNPVIPISTTLSLIALASVASYEYIEPKSPIEFIEPLPSPKSQESKEEVIITIREQDFVDYERLKRMSFLLTSAKSEDYQEYKQLCKSATLKPEIGMNFDQVRNTTWCFPYERNKTITQKGEWVQEIYLKPNYNGETHSNYSPRQYLYFSNGILVTIQE